jgi:hypothetical protein
MLEAADNTTPERTRPCDLQKLINSLKLERPTEIPKQTTCIFDTFI